MQALYASASTGDDVEGALGALSEEGRLAPEDLEFPRDLCMRCVENAARFDALIEQTAQHWRLERIARIDRIVLRMGLAELFFFLDVPPKVTINEAIELARKFSTEKSAQFVNGILDRIARTEGIIQDDTPAG